MHKRFAQHTNNAQKMCSIMCKTQYHKFFQIKWRKYVQQTVNGLDSGLSPMRCQPIIGTNAGFWFEKYFQWYLD